MKAHSLRRTFWFANLALGAAVVAIAAWYFTDVKAAVGQVMDRKASPPWSQEALDLYKGMPVDVNPIEVAVKEADIKRVILRPDDYEKRNYWIFSGPLPPPEQEALPTTAPVEVQPDGLEALGTAVNLYFIPPDKGQAVARRSLLIFKLKSGTVTDFAPGEFVKEKDGRERFKFVNVVPIDLKVPTLRVVYEVYDDPKGKAVRTAELVYDGSLPPLADGGPITPVPHPVAAGAGGTGSESPGKAPGPGVIPVSTAGDVESPRVLSVKDLKPEIAHPDNRTTEIGFDDNTIRWIKGRDIDSISKTVKTQPAKDAKTGQVIGLEITGMDDDSPADKFDVKRGDIVVSINGQPVRDRSDIVNIVQALPKDTRLVTVVLERNGRQQTYNIDPRDPETRRAARTLERPR